jgi:hypothetical protein
MLWRPHERASALANMAMASFMRLQSIANSGTQEESAQMLFHGARAYIQLTRNFLL